MTRFGFTLLLLLGTLMPRLVHAGEYSGNKMLEILGEDRNGEAVKRFKTQYILDKSLKNPELGIKLTAAHDEVSLITAITLTAAGYELNDIKYKQYADALPFDITFNDNEETLVQKLGEGKGSEDDNKLKFKKNGITINVYFKTNAKKKIAYIKYTQQISAVGPYRLDGSPAPVVAEVKPEELPTHSSSMAAPASHSAKLAAVTAAANATPKNINALPMPATFAPTAASTPVNRANKSSFYKAVMSVIESGEEELFKDIKKAPKATNNFWNYKYTYGTSVAIPGEKYNMLYSFPFQNSQLDFVSVLEETDGYSPAIQSKYAEIEAKLKDDFKLTEGWTYNYTVNQEDPKGPKDFELKNHKLGSIVLDHSINPSTGKHVLYLRFLLQYN
jgi:hypothetical protein